MGDKTGIEWTSATWNPLRGCTKVSAGCKFCYAMKVASRFPWGARVARGGQWTGVVEFVESALTKPLRWRAPRRIFVNSMSDLFHEAVPDEWIDRVFAVMALAPQHTFQVLTKRPERMREYLTTVTLSRLIGGCISLDPLLGSRRPPSQPDRWPLPNLWLGVSVEDQATADARVPLLLSTPAAVRFCSYEPALGPVDFDGGRAWLGPLSGMEAFARLDWIIVGGESGPGARPFDVAWARSTVEQCRAAGVACFVKQLGARPLIYPENAAGGRLALLDRKGGDWDEWPADLRVREMP